MSDHFWVSVAGIVLWLAIGQGIKAWQSETYVARTMDRIAVPERERLWRIKRNNFLRKIWFRLTSPLWRGDGRKRIVANDSEGLWDVIYRRGRVIIERRRN